GGRGVPGLCGELSPYPRRQAAGVCGTRAAGLWPEAILQLNPAYAPGKTLLELAAAAGDPEKGDAARLREILALGNRVKYEDGGLLLRPPGRKPRRLRLLRRPAA